VINLWFLGVFGGTAALSLVLMFLALLSWTDHRAIYLLIGGGLYLLGTIAVARIFNIPLNDALATVKPDSEAGTQTWVHYVATWTEPHQDGRIVAVGRLFYPGGTLKKRVSVSACQRIGVSACRRIGVIGRFGGRMRQTDGWT
jgi:Domain of unknown function (DUF1772)